VAWFGNILLARGRRTSGTVLAYTAVGAIADNCTELLRERLDFGCIGHLSLLRSSHFVRRNMLGFGRNNVPHCGYNGREGVING